MTLPERSAPDARPTCPLCHGGGKTWAADDGRVWVAWGVSRRQGTYSWMVEAMCFANGYNEQASGWASTYWGARRKIRRQANRMRATPNRP